jgi:probable phosphoglycerate mutase
VAEGAVRTGPGWLRARGPATTTVLLRHGETALSGERRFAGRGDIPLTATGLEQAAAAAARLAARGGLDLIITSPLERTRQTAGAVAAATGVPVVVGDGWMETDFGEWEGLSQAEAERGWPEQMAAWLNDTRAAPPGGESFAEHAGATVLVVSHVTPMKILLLHALLAPPAALRRMQLDVACLCEIDWYAGELGVVRTVNDTAHLSLPETAG